MPVMTGGQALVAALKAEGVEVVFGLPGAQIMHLFDAFHGDRDISLITPRHEQTTTFMADGYARTTGRVGVALVVPGPGVLNAGAGLATAFSASSPVLLIAGQVDSAVIGKEMGALHDVHDQLDIVRTMTKWCARVLRVEEIPGAVHEAMRQLKTGRPRPVEIEVPPDVLAAQAPVELLEAEAYPRARAAAGAIRQAAELLSAARHPLIWAGGGVLRSGATAELTALAELLGAPVMTTAEGKGAVDERHPLSAGALSFGWGPAQDIVPPADVILAVGTRLSFPPQAPWAPKASQRLINLNADAREFGKTYPAAVGLEADAQAALRQLLEALRGRERHSQWGPAEAARARAGLRDRVQRVAASQLSFMERLRVALPEDTILISGVTTLAQWSGLAFPVYRPDGYVTASYMGTLGYGFPTGLGAKVGNPDRPVVVLSGDGGFLYAGAELATAVRYGINTVTVVFRDNAYGSSKFDQMNRFGGRVIGTELLNPDFVALARAFGARGVRVEGLDAAPEAIAKALRVKGKPTVIEVPIETVTPPYGIAPPAPGR
ncbi:MAG: thiamine pyrophosphate-binding protein [Chloroflexi bacterium]|nr:thiamine pyrophosphate-binding protein [Chloroflexota bacterium]